MHQVITTAIVTWMKRAESRQNHSACAGKKGLGGVAPQQAKCKRCYLCPACYYAPGLVSYYAPGLVSGERGNVFPKKEISFRENFWSGKPSKTVISEKQTYAKNANKALRRNAFRNFQNVKTILKAM